MAAGRILSVADRSEAVLWRDGRSSIPVKTAVGSRFFTLGPGRFRRSPWRAVQSEWMSMTGSSSGEACTTSRSKVSLHELHSIRWAGLWRETPEAARSVRPRARGSVFLHAGEAILAFLHAGDAILTFVHAGDAILAFLTRAKPSWPSSACEPPFRSEPAPAGGLRRYAMSRMSPPRAGHTSGNASSIRAKSLTRAMREVSWERVAAIASPSASCADGAADDSARTLSCCGAGVFGAAARGPQDDPKTRAA